MLMGQHASTWPDLTKSKSSTGRFRLLFSTSMMTLVSSKKVAMSAGGYFIEAQVVLPTETLHPFGSALLELRVVLVLPGAGCGFQSLDLTQTQELSLSCLG